MDKEYSRKYSNALQELHENRISNLPYIRFLNYIGFHVRPIQYDGFLMSGIKMYPLWFCLFNILLMVFGDDYLIGSYALNAFLFPLLSSIISSAFFLFQRKAYKLKCWEEL